MATVFFPVSVWDDSYSGDMPAIDPKAILWNNIVALMRHSYGKENINQLHKDSGVSLATITRIKQQETLGMHPTQEPPTRRFFSPADSHQKNFHVFYRIWLTAVYRMR